MGSEGKERGERVKGEREKGTILCPSCFAKRKENTMKGPKRKEHGQDYRTDREVLNKEFEQSGRGSATRRGRRGEIYRITKT
jgi:hypothetical protein